MDKTAIREAKLTQGHARVLVTLKNEAEQKKFVEKILKENISVRDLEREAKKKSYDRQSQFSNVEESLKEVLGTRVDITFKQNKGKIIIEFYSKDDLQRIVEIISND